MRTFLLRAALLGATALAVAGPATAGTVDFDELSDFNDSGYSQGLGFCSLASGCQAVDASRIGLDKAFDAAGLSTFHSLGVFGFAYFDVGSYNTIGGATTLEATFGNQGGTSYPEAVTVILHNDINLAGVAGWVGALQNKLTDLGVTLPAADVNAAAATLQDFTVGNGVPNSVTDSALYELLNSTVLNGTGAFVAYITNDTTVGNDILAPGVNLVRGNPSADGWAFQITLPDNFGDYRYITLLDMTMGFNALFWNSNLGDGWDLADLSVQVDVPEPATAALFGLGLLAAGRLRRRG